MVVGVEWCYAGVNPPPKQCTLPKQRTPSQLMFPLRGFGFWDRIKYPRSLPKGNIIVIKEESKKIPDKKARLGVLQFLTKVFFGRGIYRSLVWSASGVAATGASMSAAGGTSRHHPPFRGGNGHTVVGVSIVKTTKKVIPFRRGATMWGGGEYDGDQSPLCPSAHVPM